MSEIVPTFETVFVLGCHHAVSLSSAKACAITMRSATCPHVSIFIVFDHGNQCDCRDCASSPTPAAAG
eukprot:scaffold114908_cov57-Phaeocystis_antarctica.AAC.3